DFGCGTGVLTVEIARWAKRVMAIDRSTSSLDAASERVKHAGLSNVTFLSADLHKLPLPAGKRGLVVLSQSLHHVRKPPALRKEAARLLKPDGRIVVLELMPHKEVWVQERLGHVHLGFDPLQLELDLRAAGFKNTDYTPYAREGASPFRVFLLTGAKK